MDANEELIGGTDGSQRRGPGRPPNAARRIMNSDDRSTFETSVRDRETTDDRDDRDEQFHANFRDSMSQSKLPALPSIPGYHTCWLTTAHQSDTIQYRLRIGYELITLDECHADMGAAAMKTGEYTNVVAVNEMVGAKLPLRLYNRYMRDMHEAEPLKQEVGLRSKVEQMRRDAEMHQSRLDEGDGMAGLGARAKPMPAFTE